MDDSWETRLGNLWATIDDYGGENFVAQVDDLVAELSPADAAIGLFERGSARDSTGHPDQAVALYRAALDAGLGGKRRRRATIQMASSLRSLGHPAVSRSPADRGTARRFGRVGRSRPGLLGARFGGCGTRTGGRCPQPDGPRPYLPRYNRSLARYAQRLTDVGPEGQPRRPGTAERPHSRFRKFVTRDTHSSRPVSSWVIRTSWTTSCAPRRMTSPTARTWPSRAEAR